MPKASDIKKNQVVEIAGNLYIVKQIEVRNPTARGAATLYKMRFADLKSGLKKEDTFKGDDALTEVELSRRDVMFSYKDGSLYTFMDKEDFSQYMIEAEKLEDQAPYLNESLEGIVALMVDNGIVAIDLPAHVTATVTETAPAIKGATATKRTKPALLSNGLTVHVPEYIANGDRVKVSTADGKYAARA